MQFVGLFFRAKHRDVFLHCALEQRVVGQRAAFGQVQLRQRLAFGAAEVQAFLHHHARRNGSDFFLDPVHAGIVPCYPPCEARCRT